MSLSADEVRRLVMLIDLHTREVSRLGSIVHSGAPTHPAFYALNRAWSALTEARDALEKPPTPAPPAQPKDTG